MGRQKELMIEQQENLARAADYLVEVGLLERCEAHHEIYGGGVFQLEYEFWRNAMADRNRGDNGPVSWAADMDAREFTDLLKEAYESCYGDSCSRCDVNSVD